MGTRIRIDSVMCPRSSSRGHNTSASVTVTVIVSCNRMPAVVVPSGECLRGERLVWFTGAVVCSLAAAAGPTVR